jgi:hypothetical protein
MSTHFARVGGVAAPQPAEQAARRKPQLDAVITRKRNAADDSHALAHAPGGPFSFVRRPSWAHDSDDVSLIAKPFDEAPQRQSDAVDLREICLGDYTDVTGWGGAELGSTAIEGLHLVVLMKYRNEMSSARRQYDALETAA